MRLRIAHISNEAFGLETASGVQQAVYGLARAQAEIGQAVAVFSRDDHAVNVLADDTESASHGPSTVVAAYRTSLRQRMLSRHFEQTLAREVLAWRPDIVHFHSVHIPENIALAAHLGTVGIAYCVTVHGALFRAALRRGWLKKTLFNLVFERCYLNDARFIHALSPDEIESIRRYGVNRPIVVVPNGLPPDSHVLASWPDALYAEYPQLRDQRVFMFVGRLDPWQKGLDVLVDAFASAGLAEASLVLVGPDWRGSRRALTKRAERHGISSRVVFMEAAFGQERANLFAAADVFVHPSRWEGLSLSVLAAAAAGKACMITREADPLGELERAQAAVVVEPSVSSIANGLRQAATLTRQELDAMGARARRVAETHFNWPSIAARLVEAYRRGLAPQTSCGMSKSAPRVLG
jgi:glycosyltransferase involved in cell wall biosynthesis